MHVWSDHVDVWNEGELPVGFTPNTLFEQHSSRPRNRNIANAFFKAGFIDAWGRGYKKIREGFESAGLPMPKVENFCGGVRVTFQRKNVNTAKPDSADTQNVAVNVAEELTERQRIIVELIKKGVADNVALNVAVNTKYLSEKLNVNRKTIQREVALLQERQLIQWVGSDKTGHWVLINHKE
jgi:ATP-dependent DNA helicase RecG